MSSRIAFSALQGKRLHMGVCGSIAAYKAVDIMRALQKAGINVSVCLSEAATRFICPLSFASLSADPVYTALFGDDEGARFAHLEPGRVADAFLLAPATAATLARLANGLADNMLAAQALAFSGPLVIAPAMNPRLWQHPACQRNVHILRERGCLFVGPDAGPVACGDSGVGKLADPEEIILAAAKSLLPQDLDRLKILVTLGPTREPFDGVRVWTNLSTGRMGSALVHAAWLRGAEVHALAGPGTPALPRAVHRHDVDTAGEMFAAAERLWPDMDWGIFSAAVADFSPEPHGSGKYKKDGREDGFTLRFFPNKDILATLSARKSPQQKILGFAAETDNLEEQAKAKLQGKCMHLIAANLVGVPGSGFAGRENRVFVCDQSGRQEHWPTMNKTDVAWRLLDWLSTL